jgi:hypothetical protein
MTGSDPYVMLVIQAAIVLGAGRAFFADVRIRERVKGGALSGEVTRGDKSMAALYTVYGASMASCLVLIDNASGLGGHKVGLITLDFLCLTYVFFLSSWFRNNVFFPLMQRVRKD